MAKTRFVNGLWFDDQAEEARRIALWHQSQEASFPELWGTGFDRAGADHLDIALHDPGSPRRTGEVTGYRMVPFAALAWVRAEDGLSVL